MYNSYNYLLVCGLKRVYATKDTWRYVYNTLKQNGYSLNKIRKEIGTRFENQLYLGYGMNLQSFNKLQQIFGFNIPTIPNPFFKMQVTLEKDVKLAELIGIILGDGGISRKHIAISIHSKSKGYIGKVSDLIESVFAYKPKFHKRKNKDVIDLKIHSIGIVNALHKYGLTSGNKVKHQVSIPKWIKEDNSFYIACIRGLIDTDGYIGKYKKTNGKYTWYQYHVGFDNYSLNLLNDFIEFCNRFDIPVSRTSKYKVIIGSRKGVLKILKLTQPFKLRKVNFSLSELES